jgi:predicted phosphodiesterase
MRRIKPGNNNDRIILQFTNPIATKRESITCGDWGSKKDMRYAENLAEASYTDWITGNFDQTLERYRLIPNQEIGDTNADLQV